MSERKFWLMKSEPYAFSIDDLAEREDNTTYWEGIRNYEARNFMRDQMNVGDGVLFYHSNVKPPCIVGSMRVASEPYPDPSQFDPDSKYFDKKATEEKPRWQLVDVQLIQKFDREIPRDELKEDDVCSEMMIFKRMRLSITPVTEEEWNRVHKLAGAEPTT